MVIRIIMGIIFVLIVLLAIYGLLETGAK